MDNQIQGRLDALRKLMAGSGIAAAIVPQTDPHQSEYLADHWQLRRFLSGFTGSAGTLVVTADRALLWTDSRYFLQAGIQLKDSGIELMKEGIEGTPTVEEWLAANLPAGSTVGFDGMLFSMDATDSLAARLGARGITIDVSFDVADSLWPDRPALPDCTVIVHDEKYAGQSAVDKTDAVLTKAQAQGATSVLISPLDEIAWILNIRSRDVEYNPVVTSFLYLSPEGNTLFVDEAKITPEVRAYLGRVGVETAPYQTVKQAMAALPADARVLLSTSQSSGAFASILGDRAVAGDSAVADLKAEKNPCQIEGIRNAMVRDGVALVGAFREIERLAAEGTLTELKVAEILRDHRSKQDLYYDESFGTIAGWAGHGAIVHYDADEESSSTITKDSLLLIDSGAQYLDGTTDITRTIAIGEPTDQMRHDFTLVMKGHIALALAVWPAGTNGLQLDTLARQFLWREGLTYLHGTGHGVGHFLNVHEGPQKISLLYKPAPLVPGMITSNEPGLYRTDEYGIRCENLTLVVPVFETEFGKFYGFETLTLFPFDRRLFDLDAMTEEEIEWVDRYHEMVYDRLSPALSGDDLAWLREKTRSLLVLD